MDSPRLRMRSSLDYPRPVLNQRMLTNGSHSSTGSTGSTGSTALNAPNASSSLGAPNGMAGLAGPSGLSGPTNSLMHVGSYKTRPRNLQQSSIVIPSFSPPTGAIPDTSGSVDVDDLNAIDLTGSSVSLDLNGSMDPLFFSSKKAPSSPIPKLDLGEPLMLSTNSSASNDYLVLDMDGILVPFFIEEYRFKNDSVALVKFDGIDTAEQARRFTNVEVYFPLHLAAEATDEGLSWAYFVGFEVSDVHHGELGRVVAVDESTVNTLFVIEHDGRELLVPAHEEFIRELDHEQRRMLLQMPDGLLQLGVEN